MLPHLTFKAHIGIQKPETLINRAGACPFCDLPSLEKILDRQGPLIWLENKYPVLEAAYQTLIIETEECEAELADYTQEQWRDVLQFGLDKWRQMDSSGEFKSVLFFKNHGPLSGGTLRHPHMQLIGLQELDYRTEIESWWFEGMEIVAKGAATLTISTRPVAGFNEFNVVSSDTSATDDFADLIRLSVQYVMKHFPWPCTSYNLFFYQLPEGLLACKLLPRFATSPLLLGYSIRQVPNNLQEHVDRMRTLFF